MKIFGKKDKACESVQTGIFHYHAATDKAALKQEKNTKKTWAEMGRLLESLNCIKNLADSRFDYSVQQRQDGDIEIKTNIVRNDHPYPLNITVFSFSRNCHASFNYAATDCKVKKPQKVVDFVIKNALENGYIPKPQ